MRANNHVTRVRGEVDRLAIERWEDEGGTALPVQERFRGGQRDISRRDGVADHGDREPR